ncbi:MAG: glycosyltransferase [Thermosynechococcaceae cyanobacterium]
MIKKIGIYRKAFPKASETFIQEQAVNLRRYEPIFLLCRLLEPIAFDSITIGSKTSSKLRQLLYLISRSPRFFLEHPSIQGLSLIHAHFGPEGVYAMPIAAALNIPFCVTFHGYDITINRQNLLFSRPLYYQLIWHEAKLKQQATAFIAVSKFIQAKLIEAGYPPEKIIQHYIGVDTHKFSPINSAPSQRYILCVGRHAHKKGIDILFRAFAKIADQHPGVSLLQVGQGALTKMLNKLIQDLDLADRIRLLGQQPHSEVLKLMQQAEIFALPSHQAADGDCEALGIVFNEASACGVPVISTQHGGIPEAVMEGETGFLVPEKDVEALAARLDQLLSHRDLGRKMGAQGRAFVCDAFDIEKQTRQLEAIYDAMITPVSLPQ